MINMVVILGKDAWILFQISKSTLNPSLVTLLACFSVFNIIHGH